MSDREPISDEMIEEIKKTDHVRLLRCRAQAPYEGCWYEQNFWMISGKGQIHPIYVSGKIGSDLIKKLFNSMDDAVQTGIGTEVFVEWLRSNYWGDYYVDFDTFEPKDVDVPYNIINLVRAVLRRFGAESEDLPTEQCAHCGEMIEDGPIRFGSYSGNGGVGIDLDDPHCNECFGLLRYCNTCNDYVYLVSDPDGNLDCPNRVKALDEAQEKEPRDDEDDGEDDQEDGADPDHVMDKDDPCDEHDLVEAEDAAEQFGLAGDVLDPDRGEGPPPVILIFQKGA